MTDTPSKAEKLLNEARSYADYWEARRLRARERLEANNVSRAWHFALLGLKASFERVELGYGALRQVIEPPGEVELASALKQSELFSTVARYTHGLAYELVLPVEHLEDQHVFNIAWWITSTLRIRTRADFIVPIAADFSWSTITAAVPGSVEVVMLEDHPRSRIIEPGISITEEEVRWAELHYVTFASLAEDARFRMAAEAITTHHQQASARMMVAHLWAGIEALFGIQAELRFRLAALIAVLLEDRGEARVRLYRKIKRLYDVRSKAVHGSAMTEEQLQQHSVEARTLLSRLLQLFLDQGTLPSVEELEVALFR